MRQLLLIIATICAISAYSQGITKHGQSTILDSDFVNRNGQTDTVPLLNKNGKMLDSLVDLNPDETFVNSDAPVNHIHENLSFQSPWGYKKAGNASRHYPLLVVGLWGEGENYYKAVAQHYPAFVINYQKNTESDGQVLGRWIKSAIEAGYRIDLSRIYLTGFSMGGSGSYPLAKGMFVEKNYFAAIIRVAGQSQPDLGNEIARHTAVWYHIGLSDSETRVGVAREALNYMRNYECNSAAIETSSSDINTGYARTTVTLTRSGFPMFKYSEYANMGHIPGPCYTDQYLMTWLFNHSLKYR